MSVRRPSAFAVLCGIALLAVVLFLTLPLVAILTDKPGKVKFVDIVEELTVREELDESTGLRQRVIVEDRDKSLHPRIQIISGKEKIRDYIVPTGAHLLVRDDEVVADIPEFALVAHQLPAAREYRRAVALGHLRAEVERRRQRRGVRQRLRRERVGKARVHGAARAECMEYRAGAGAGKAASGSWPGRGNKARSGGARPTTTSKP